MLRRLEKLIGGLKGIVEDGCVGGEELGKRLEGRDFGLHGAEGAEHRRVLGV